MNRLLCASLLELLLATFAADACAQTASSGRPSSGSHDLMLLARKLRLQGQQVEFNWSLEIGVAGDRDEMGVKVLTTPFDLTWKPQGDSGWVFDLAGDGYTRARDPSDTRGTGQGIASPTFEVSRDIVEGINAQLAITAPRTSAPGSDSTWQRIKILGTNDLDKYWKLQMGASLRHDEHPAAGTSRWKQTLLGLVTRNLEGGDTLTGGIAYSQRGGTRNGFELSAEFDHEFSKRLTGIMQLTRGVTSGSKHATVEFDGSWKF